MQTHKNYRNMCLVSRGKVEVYWHSLVPTTTARQAVKQYDRRSDPPIDAGQGDWLHSRAWESARAAAAPKRPSTFGITCLQLLLRD